MKVLHQAQVYYSDVNNPISKHEEAMMKTLLLSVVMVACSTASYAFTRENNQASQYINAGVSDSREGAYRQGQTLANNIRSESPRKLKRTLGIYEYGLKTNSIKVDNSHIQVDEFSNAKGEVKYRAIVNVDYSYNTFESDNR